MFAGLFWSNLIRELKKHWSTPSLFHPHEERRMGFENLHDISKALFVKIWWNLRTNSRNIYPEEDDNWIEVKALGHIIPVCFDYDKTIVLVKEIVEEG
ncbi:hypothetical protein H5410_046145 [Solanum commersonii]|uniref:Uncharacterized protein n=1 Tax=Solanum commersonii TaxID=4109 RepID=A0A9J5XDM8_SOLCO|nr:hypothetical protein H5410_046145 [Solanum commersonii]